MPWCPKCRDEFRDGFTECRKCGVQLVDKLEEEPEKDNPRNSVLDVHEEWAFLMNTKDEIEADSFEALLGACEIPVLRTHNDYSTLAHVYTGKSNFGADLLVPASRLEEAKEILASNVDIPEEALLEVEEAEQDQYLEELVDEIDESGNKVVYNKNRKGVAWVLLAVIAAFVLIELIFGPFGLLRLFKR